MEKDMRTHRLKISGMITSVALIAAATTGCQYEDSIGEVKLSPVVPTPLVTIPLDSEFPPNQDQGEQWFLLTNARSQAILRFHASPSDTDDRESNILSGSVLMPGEDAWITINNQQQSCVYNFRAVFEDNSEVEDDVNICDLSSYTFH